MSNVIKKAEQLGDALVESEQFQEMVQAENTLDADKEASKLVEEVERLQHMIDTDRGNDELKKEMAELQKKIWSTPTTKNYLQKQQKFSQLMKKVNDVLMNAMQPEHSHEGHDHDHAGHGHSHNHDHGDHGCCSGGGGCC
ncbi:YlbF family regulator [Halanaerobium hydrogeniformans]|uniref:Uncharacterized protein n=1 Tax=Halanaerobium hydrogeniformans TaxID=656519 RepID=E4RNY6_HALHG|nr:YlbF family regulator [Halanaerobium hydrogeniformans]ADQ13676.1 hypothetical protein Halsa_0187 [Halanaerobium hydrogeniformans]